MKNNSFFLISFICCCFLCCKKSDNVHNGLELEILTKELNYNQNINTKTKLTYKLTNYTDKKYYFNENLQSNVLGKLNKFVSLNNSCLFIQNPENDTIKVTNNFPDYSLEYGQFLNELTKPIKELGYHQIKAENILFNKNFVIHPNETLYFEDFVYLPYGKYDDLYKFDSINEKSYATIFIFSDTTDIRKTNSVPTMQNIKENNYTVFHGIIKSKNKIPIKILK